MSHTHKAVHTLYTLQRELSSGRKSNGVENVTFSKKNITKFIFLKCKENMKFKKQFRAIRKVIIKLSSGNESDGRRKIERRNKLRQAHKGISVKCFNDNDNSSINSIAIATAITVTLIMI